MRMAILDTAGVKTFSSVSRTRFTNGPTRNDFYDSLTYAMSFVLTFYSLPFAFCTAHFAKYTTKMGKTEQPNPTYPGQMSRRRFKARDNTARAQ